VLAYANTIHTPFLFDDVGAVMENATIRRLDSLAIFSPPTDGSTATGRPVVNFSFAINYAVSGENPWSYHALNLAIHAAATLTLFGLLRRTLSSSVSNLSAALAEPTALVAAALWSLHPLQTESVTCVAQRTESLCGLFYLLTLYAFARGCAMLQRSSRRWLALSVACSFVGMATKEVMVTAPLVVFLYDRTFVAGSFAAAWRARRSYYFALAATWSVLLALLSVGSGARGASAGFALGVSWWNYLLTQCEALLLYLRLAAWPHPLILDYGTSIARSLAEVWWQGLLVLSLLAATGWSLVRRPALGFAGACFFLILSPSSSFVPLVTQTMAEHRMYLPLAPLVAVVVLSLGVRFGRTALTVLSVVAVAAFVGTVARNRTYRDAVTIWTDNVANRPLNPRGHLNLALALHHAGRIAEAHASFARAVALDPGYVTAQFNWAVALLAESRTDEAISRFETTVRLAPDHVDAHRQLAAIAERGGRPTDVEKHFGDVLRLVPGDLTAHRKLGLLLARAERLAPAAEHFRAVLRQLPDDADAHANLGNVLLLTGQTREAITSYESALRLRPGDPRTRENLQIARESLR
jgi:tetratricopeptide (TPR) repeat protein